MNRKYSFLWSSNSMTHSRAWASIVPDLLLNQVNKQQIKAKCGRKQKNPRFTSLSFRQLKEEEEEMPNLVLLRNLLRKLSCGLSFDGSSDCHVTDSKKAAAYGKLQRVFVLSY